MFYVESTNTVSSQGGTYALFIKKAADQLGIGPGQTMCSVLFRPEDKDLVHSRLNGVDTSLFFAVVTDHVISRRSIDEDSLLRSLEDDGIKDAIILGPFSKAEDVAIFKYYLKDNHVGLDRESLEKAFREFLSQ